MIYLIIIACIIAVVIISFKLWQKNAKSNALFGQDEEFLLECRGQCANIHEIDSEAFQQCVAKCYAKKSRGKKNKTS
jgi:hypothetical protein